MGIWYTTRERVMSATDNPAAARSAANVDRAIEAGARSADALLHRACFAPTLATRRFDWPGPDVAGGTLYLGQHLLISLSAVVAGSTTLTAADYLLEPVNEGPPYRRVNINEGSNAWWSNATTPQQALAFTGLWGWSDDSLPAGVTAEALDTSETAVDVGPLVNVGIGSVIKVESERMVVTDRSWATTGQTGTLAAAMNAQTLAVSSGAAFVAGDRLLIGSERVEVVDVSGNNLSIVRAVDGTTLAAHTTTTIYAQRTLTVVRGALGTTAAAHDTAAAVTVWDVPGLLAELNEAYAVNTLQQRSSSWARTVGSGDNEREATGRGIKQIEADARAVYGRQARTAAV